MKKVRPHARGTYQFLTFVGPRGMVARHPVVQSVSCSFLTTRFPKLASVYQQDEYRKARA